MLLGVPDIELLDILKIFCEVMGDSHESKNFGSETIQVSSVLSCKANKVQQIKADNADASDANSNIPEYLRSSINRAADKRAS